ncbi:MAG TPA: hypothetical protein VE152_07055, partial [Acidimicrobiales bacterium]|nr:hypothetical protein [Acidimicrobiales bacterium]
AAGGTQLRSLSLARTAWWLTSAPAAPPPAPGAQAGDVDPSPWVVELASADGPVAAVAPPGQVGGRALRWPAPVTGYGSDRPRWSLR